MSFTRNPLPSAATARPPAVSSLRSLAPPAARFARQPLAARFAHQTPST